MEQKVRDTLRAFEALLNCGACDLTAGNAFTFGSSEWLSLCLHAKVCDKHKAGSLAELLAK